MSDNNTKEYEIYYFTSITLTPEEISNVKKTVADIIAKHDGTIIKEEDMGKKKLAYMIKNTRHGYFIYTIFKSSTDQTGEIKKEITLIPEVLRYRLTTREKIDVITPSMETEMKEKIKPQTPTIEKKDTKTEKPKEKVDLKELDLKINELLSDDNL